MYVNISNAWHQYWSIEVLLLRFQYVLQVFLNTNREDECRNVGLQFILLICNGPTVIAFNWVPIVCCNYDYKRKRTFSIWTYDLILPWAECHHLAFLWDNVYIFVVVCSQYRFCYKGIWNQFFQPQCPRPRRSIYSYQFSNIWHSTILSIS